jgi:hypothetical protein
VAVDGSGAAHVTFSEHVGGQDVTHYCLLPNGAAACADPPRTFTYPQGANFGSDSGVWPLLPGDGRVLVFDARCCQSYATKYVYVSSDGGTTFDAGTVVGSDDNSGTNIAGGALYAPANAIGRPAESLLSITDLATLGLSFQAVPTTGPPETATRNDVITQGDASDGSLGLSGKTLVAAWLGIDDTTVYWRQWTGSGDVNDSSNWTPITPLELGNINAAPRLASGPGGIYIAYNSGTSAPLKTVVRKFTGSGWGPPLALNADGTPRFDIVEDPTGTLHYVWDDRGALRYRFGNDPENSAFSPPQTLVADNNTNGGFTNLRLGVGTNGEWVTWEDSSPTHVKALPVSPEPSLPPPTQGSTVNAVPEKGKVFVKLPAGASGNGKASGFVPLESLGQQLPVGSTLDTRKGTVRLTSAANSSGKTQDGDFSKGLFNISQGRKNPLTTVSMTGGGLGACSKLPKGGAPKADAGAAKRGRRRTLFSNVHGRFRTRGRNSAATVRGTRFTVTDTCKGTLTQVKSGTVKVRDFWLRKTRTVKAGHSYLARRASR